MRLEIFSTDRLGISQEILSELAKLGLNISAMEVASGVIYLHVESRDITFAAIHDRIVHVNGVSHCQQLDLMPNELKQQHLQALLNRIPDPIFDLDADGKILSCNHHRHIYISRDSGQVLGIKPHELKREEAFSRDVSFEEQSYQAEITPLWLEGIFSGAVVILKSLDKVAHQLSNFQQSISFNGIDDIVGESAIISEVKAQLIKFADLDLPILIHGETGTGKELVARAIHLQSHRKAKPFLAINCAALPEQLLESELFGYVAGAFTGANTKGKPGLFELANGGTVFLDEIAEMSVYLQAKLLRFLQDYSFRRLGGSKEVHANVRIISASHQPFERLVAQGRFREDLYYRLNVLNLGLPPLKARASDIRLLCDYFIEQACQQTKLAQPELLPDALSILLSYDWPGNIRQLQNVMFRLTALNSGEQITAVMIKQVLSQFTTQLDTVKLDGKTESEGQIPSKLASASWLSIADWQEAQRRFETSLLTELYPHFPSTRKLAERLNVSHNKIAMKLRQYGIKN
ncbi:AAA family ATPase [Thalassotalea euphylliae]|uniref:HTH-type transcriptional regulatory protein TyrR n=1 Tax=Thalassotalea euphylliae TaxID=1655234 RepID=A0A3E0TRZ5_9GAMM|nr:sigma 54-interacting transcriptional regulator [Thalassotalea euphylliae]REL27411.1 AAA family ATPase [Thalassotalea euphylliae]